MKFSLDIEMTPQELSMLLNHKEEQNIPPEKIQQMIKKMILAYMYEQNQKNK